MDSCKPARYIQDIDNVILTVGGTCLIVLFVFRFIDYIHNDQQCDS